MSPEWVSILALIAVVLFVVLGGRELASRRIDADEMNAPEEDHVPAGAGAHRDRTTLGTGERTDRGGAVDTAARSAAAPKVLLDQVITLVAFIAVAVVALVFDRNIGFTAIVVVVGPLLVWAAIVLPGWV